MPITVAIVLVLRARGVCCGGPAFQRIDRPPKQPTETAAGGPAAEPAAIELSAVVGGRTADAMPPPLPAVPPPTALPAGSVPSLQAPPPPAPLPSLSAPPPMVPPSSSAAAVTAAVTADAAVAAEGLAEEAAYTGPPIEAERIVRKGFS